MLNSKLGKKCSTRAASLQIQMRLIRRDVVEYFLIRDTAGVTPIPEATAITFSLSIAGELNGDRKGPATKAGLCEGVVISFIRACVQSPHLLMHIDEVLGMLPGKTVNAWNWKRLIHGSIKYTYAELCSPKLWGFSKVIVRQVSLSL